jgi:hypothetical protein
MPTPSDITKTLDLYVAQLKEIKYRINVVLAITYGNRYTTPYPATNVELVYLQLRKILELIALSSLVANKEEYAKIEREFATEWRAKKILKKIKDINADYYPRPSRQIKGPQSGRFTFEPITSGYLTEENFVELYSLSSNLIHARNPYAPEVDLDLYKSRINEWEAKIRTLLNHHSILLYGGKNMIAALMQSDKDGEPHASYFAKMENPPIAPGVTQRGMDEL